MSIRITYINYTDTALEAIIRNKEDRSIAIKNAIESVLMENLLGFMV